MSLRNPPAFVRVAIVACVFAMPGVLAGAMAALFLGGFLLCSVVGGLLGALTGGCLEGWPASERDGIPVDGSDHDADRMEELESRWHYWSRHDHTS